MFREISEEEFEKNKSNLLNGPLKLCLPLMAGKENVFT